jgi:Pilin (bacterial filament)
MRAQVSDAFPLAEQLKPAAAEHYQSEKSWPVGVQELTLSQPIAGRYMSNLSVDHGTISVTFGNLD